MGRDFGVERMGSDAPKESGCWYCGRFSNDVLLFVDFFFRRLRFVGWRLMWSG